MTNKDIGSFITWHKSFLGHSVLYLKFRSRWNRKCSKYYWIQKHLQLFCFQYLSNIISPEGDKPSWGWWGVVGVLTLKLWLQKLTIATMVTVIAYKTMTARTKQWRHVSRLLNRNNTNKYLKQLLIFLIKKYCKRQFICDNWTFSHCLHAWP